MSSVSSLVSQTVAATSAAASPSSSNRATPQGGILEGANPTHYDPKNPLILFIIQATIIVIFCRLLHWPLSKFRQPRVIAEVIGGVILGPSVMMRIPGFEAAIFPAAAMPNLNLVANIGLVLFLFLVGLEVNVNMFMSNWRVAMSVGLAGMMLPFGMGCAIAWGLFNEFRDDPDTVPITFPVYMLFIGTALAITAFPVLCRILTELKLLSTPVGVTVLAAGVGNDVVGWILLALCVALVNNGSGLVALYVLLCCVGWGLFLVFAVKPAFIWILRRNGSLQNGPSQTMISLTLLIVFISAWFTGIIGVHPIFGAFMVGVICPHEGGFAIKVTEKIEDLVSALFLPLYFALSGLSTNLGLLDNGVTWGYVIAIIVLAFAGKIIGGTLAAKACKLVWRESFSIGVLMSCKGLVELIVLNIGLQARILSKRTFTMFVVMALVTTVATTPLTTALYPLWYQKKLEAWKKGEIDWEGNRLDSEGRQASEQSLEKIQEAKIRRLLVFLNLEGLPSLFTFIALLGGDRPATVTKTHRSRKTPLSSVTEIRTPNNETTSEVEPKRPLEVHGLRLIHLTDRTSSVMQSAVTEGYGYSDPVINTFQTFAQLHNVAASGTVSVVPESSYAEALTSMASDNSSDLVLVPWNEGGVKSDHDSITERSGSSPQDAFVQKTLEKATCNIAIFVNRGFGAPAVEGRQPLTRTISGMSRRSNQETPIQPIEDRSHHVYFPFFGGVDDRAALRFVLQLAHNSNITVSVLYFSTPDSKTPATVGELLGEPSARASGLDISGKFNREEANIEATQDAALLHSLRDSLPEELASRVVFVDVPTTTPVSDALSHARQEIAQTPRNAGDLVVVGRSNHASISAFESELTTNPAGAEMRKTLGIVAEAMVSGGVRGSILVLHAGGRDLEG